MNFLDKHNKMLFVMAKESISRRDLNKAEKIIGTLEARDYRRRVACESQKPVVKKNKAEQSDGFGANSELIGQVHWPR